MKHNPNKQRHRGGRPQGKRNGFGYNPLNRNFDSTGPDIKVRGNAYQIYEKYQQMARDANSAGDRVSAENFLQHAEHYYRILNHDGQWAERQQQQQQQQYQQQQMPQQQGQGMQGQGMQGQGMQGQGMQGQGMQGQVMQGQVMHPQQQQYVQPHQGQPQHGGHQPQLNQPPIGPISQPNQGPRHGHDGTQDDYPEPDLNNPGER